MKLITSLSLTFIFCFCIVMGSSNAQGNLDTPFIKKYKKYYEANDIALDIIIGAAIVEFSETYTQSDKIAIKKLADAGDLLALAMLIFTKPMMPYVSDNLTNNMIDVALKGEPQALYWLELLNRGGDKISIENELIKSATKGYAMSYRALMSYYLRKGDTLKYCSIAQQGFKKFGFEILAPTFTDGGKGLEVLLNNCTRMTQEQVLSKQGDEGKLVEGYINLKAGKYNEAYDIFNKLYKNGDTSKVSSNAGYCLGMMNYYGKGIKADKAKGSKLLKESFNNGVYYVPTPGQDKFILPKTLKLNSYLVKECINLGKKK